MTLKVIAYARNGHTDKFGIPRQSRDESPIRTRIVFEPDYRIPEALRGIEGFSHLWLLWGFSEVQTLQTADAEGPQAEHAGLSWSPTVRPPRLGGNKRMGVFATRSPFRPNPIGMSSVRLLKVENGDLIVCGADLLDGTPIYDIKPYLSFSDSHEDAKNGFAEEQKDYRLEVQWSKVESLMSREWFENGSRMTREWVGEVTYILSQDPRPGYQDDPEREYKLDYDGFTVSFVVQEGQAIVQNIEKM